MTLLITTLGAFPKPAYVDVPDWFSNPPAVATVATTHLDADVARHRAIERGVAEVVRAQVAAGVDIPTDGEVARENYVHYHCRRLHGFDFSLLNRRTLRAGTWSAEVPTIVGPVSAGTSFLPHDYRLAQAASPHPVKMTMPGPMTIIDSVANLHYQTDRELGAALAIALNVEVRRLADVGCTQIQVDEPVMARYPQAAMEWGIALLAEVFAGLPDEVTRTVHICCGYPDRLDAVDYPKADPAAYQTLLPLLDAALSVDVLSIEDAHRHNDLAVLETLERTILALGSLRIASSTVEQADDIARRVETVLGAIPPERLVLAPDCGLGMLSRSVAIAKLEALRQTADLF